MLGIRPEGEASNTMWCYNVDDDFFLLCVLVPRKKKVLHKINKAINFIRFVIPMYMSEFADTYLKYL